MDDVVAIIQAEKDHPEQVEKVTFKMRQWLDC